MKTIWKTTAGAVVINVLLTIVIFAQAASPARTAPSNRSTTDFVTGNGVKTIHRLVTGNEVLAVQVYFRGGTRNISEKNAGIESVLFDVASEGTKNFSKSEINRELARMGTIVDAASGYDYSFNGDAMCASEFRPFMAVAHRHDSQSVLRRKRDHAGQGSDDQRAATADRQPRIISRAAQQQTALHLAPLFQSAGRHGRICQLADRRRPESAPRQTASNLTDAGGGSRKCHTEELKGKVDASFGKLPRGDYKPEAPPVFAKASTDETSRLSSDRSPRITFAGRLQRLRWKAPTTRHFDYHQHPATALFPGSACQTQSDLRRRRDFAHESGRRRTSRSRLRSRTRRFA